MSQRSLYLLSPPRVERDGSEVPIPRHKAMALLAYLALTRRRHRRDTLATLLWPEHDQATARAYLRRGLTALRNALGEDWLDADRETVGLDPDADLWLDVDAFHGQLVALRAVNTDDFMTATWSQLPHDLLARASSRIVNEVKGVNRVVYDVSSKPPATIEWE